MNNNLPEPTGGTTMTLPRTTEPEVMDSAQEAEDYDAMDHTDVNHRFVDDYLAFAGDELTESSRVSHLILDTGSGTAQIPILLSSRLTTQHAIIACDLSQEMLRVARCNIRTAGCGRTVIPILCNARQLPVRNRSCHHLISNSIIHHLPDPVVAFSELRRIAAPNAVVFIRDLLRPDTADDVERLVLQWAGPATEHQQQMFRESLHAALTTAEIRDMLLTVRLNPDWVRQTTDRHWTIAGRMPGN